MCIRDRLSTIAATAAASFAGASQDPSVLAQAAVHSYTTAFWWSAGVFALGGVISFLLLTPGTKRAHERLGDPVMAH